MDAKSRSGMVLQILARTWEDVEKILGDQFVIYLLCVEREGENNFQ